MRNHEQRFRTLIATPLRAGSALFACLISIAAFTPGASAAAAEQVAASKRR